MNQTMGNSGRVGITQRVEVSETGERRDALDQQWQRFLAAIGMIALPLPNLSLRDGGDDAFFRWRGAFPVDALILSGGATPAAEGVPDGETTPERDIFEKNLIGQCLKRGIPVLGVCRGFQMLAAYFGATLARVGGHVAVRHKITFTNGDSAEIREVNSFHNYAVDPRSFPDCLERIATSEDGCLEAFRHRELPAFAIMWHPERESAFREWEQELFRATLGNGENRT